jgi:hypothetical protein
VPTIFVYLLIIIGLVAAFAAVNRRRTRQRIAAGLELPAQDRNAQFLSHLEAAIALARSRLDDADGDVRPQYEKIAANLGVLRDRVARGKVEPVRARHEPAALGADQALADWGLDRRDPELAEAVAAAERFFAEHYWVRQ